VHEHADLFTAIELYATKAAATAVFLRWLYRHLKEEFRR
jgi:hypothetical protein